MDALAIIMAYAGDEGLHELTEKRTAASLPVGGRYRLIDFALSNAVNAGINKVGVITHHNYQSLMDHVGNGKDWDLSRKNGGLFILPPFFRGEVAAAEPYRGWLEALMAANSFIRRSTNKYVFLLPGEYAYNIDFDDVLEQHIRSGADITCVYHPTVRSEEHTPDFVYQFDQQRMVEALYNPPVISEAVNVSMEMFVMERTLLENILRSASMRSLDNFMRDVIVRNTRGLNICGYCFSGYVRKVSTVRDYLELNMDMLKKEVRDELFGNPGNPIYTKVRDEMPARYSGASSVKNSIVADGCTVEGTLENCVLFRGVHVGRGAVVKNSILMQNAEVLDGATLDTVIMDKQAVVRSQRTLIGQERIPAVVAKDMII